MKARRASVALAFGFLILTLISGCNRPLTEVRRNPRLFTHAQTDAGEWLGLEGHWWSPSDRYSIELPRINSVAVNCWRKRMVCVEHLAKLIEPGELGGLVAHPTLFAFGNEYRIVEWSDSTLIARFEPRAANIELRVSFADKTAERTYRETSARGATGISPEARQWILE
jgi:hypothetical protein